jgi:hypothetical protein
MDAKVMALWSIRAQEPVPAALAQTKHAISMLRAQLTTSLRQLEITTTPSGLMLCFKFSFKMSGTMEQTLLLSTILPSGRAFFTFS